MPREGDAAPLFDLPVATGGRLALDDLRGHWFALFFFPKARTPG